MAGRPGDGRGEGLTLNRLPAAVRLSFLAGPMLSMIDSSVVNVAVPGIVGGLHTSLGTAAWAVSGYLLGLACGLAATPWLARRYGTLPAYGAALLAFTLASAACALVPSVTLLIAARVVQGLAGMPRVRSPARAGSRMRLIASGTIGAPARPCTTRAAMSRVTLGTRAHAAEARVKASRAAP